MSDEKVTECTDFDRFANRWQRHASSYLNNSCANPTALTYHYVYLASI